MTFAKPTFDTDLDTEGFHPTKLEREAIATEVARIQPLVAEFPTQILHANKATMSGDMEHAHAAAGTTMEVEPNRRMDGQQVASAVEQGNYTEFRRAMYPIEASLRDRVGRWVQRYPQVQRMIGERFSIADIVEETFMLAFDRFSDWQPEMFFGQWIESLIDPAMKAIAKDPEGELEVIGFLRSCEETPKD